MSEKAATPIIVKRSHIRIFAVALPVLILLLVYGAGIIVLPISILNSYQNRDCSAVLSRNRIYGAAYPVFIQDATLSVWVAECESYTSASLVEAKGLWSDTYDAYQEYLARYPNGSYTADAQDKSASALLNMARDLADQKQYDEALSNLNRIITGFSTVPAAADAWTLVPVIYTGWGETLRAAGDFDDAERVFREYHAWSRTYQKTTLAIQAEHELARTYLAWGLGFESQKRYEDALAKFDAAMSMDPQLQFDSSAQAKAGRRNVYIEWGNDLLEQDQLPAAMGKFETAVSFAEGDNDNGARDALANGYIHWASDLSTAEDFEGALERLELARRSAMTDTMKQVVETAVGDTYLAFSSSTGKQAQRAIKAALKAVCEKRKKPELPIFGLNKDVVGVGIHGAEIQLPEDLAAKTPGEMHFIACITEDNRTIESRQHRVLVLQTSRGYYSVIIPQFRVQLIWDISLLHASTLKKTSAETFEGGMPPPFPASNDPGGAGYFYGPSPAAAAISEWLRSAIR